MGWPYHHPIPFSLFFLNPSLNFKVSICLEVSICTFSFEHFFISSLAKWKYNRFSKDWADTPISTSVAQIPIESVVYPAVTLCAMTSTAEEPSLENVLSQCSFTRNNRDTGEVCSRAQVCFHKSFSSLLCYLSKKIFNEYGPCLTFNNMDVSTNSSNYPAKVQGVGLENSLRIKLNKDLEKEDVHYRVFISEVGTTVSKVMTNTSLSNYKFIKF